MLFNLLTAYKLATTTDPALQACTTTSWLELAVHLGPWWMASLCLAGCTLLLVILVQRMMMPMKGYRRLYTAAISMFHKSVASSKTNKTETFGPSWAAPFLAVAHHHLERHQPQALDFFEDLLKVGGKLAILTVVDRLSMYDHFNL